VRVTGRHQILLQDLRSTFTGIDVGIDFVVPRPCKCGLDRKASIGLERGMNMLKVRHILADNEQMKEFVVGDMKLFHLVASPGVEEGKAQSDLFVRLWRFG